MSKKITLDEAKYEFEKRGYVPQFTEYKGNLIPLAYICPKHPDKIQHIRLNDLKRNHGCKFCGGTAKITLEETKYEFEKRGYIPQFTEYEGCMVPLAYICPKHPDEIQHISLHDLKANKGCKFCGGKVKITLEEAKQEFIKRGYIPQFTEYKDNKIPLAYVCPKHPDEIQHISLANLKHNHGCRFCNASKMEKFTSQWLTDRNYFFINDKVVFSDLISPYGGTMRPDFIIYNADGSIKVWIETHGVQHKEPISFGGDDAEAEIKFKKTQNRDQAKRDYAKLHNIRLIEIWHDEDLEARLNEIFAADRAA